MTIKQYIKFAGVVIFTVIGAIVIIQNDDVIQFVGITYMILVVFWLALVNFIHNLIT